MFRTVGQLYPLLDLVFLTSLLYSVIQLYPFNKVFQLVLLLKATIIYRRTALMVLASPLALANQPLPILLFITYFLISIRLYLNLIRSLPYIVVSLFIRTVGQPYPPLDLVFLTSLFISVI